MQRKRYFDAFNDSEKHQRNRIQQQLGIKLDEVRLLRCHGRLANADPKLLPKYKQFTILLITKIHQR